MALPPDHLRDKALRGTAAFDYEPRKPLAQAISRRARRGARRRRDCRRVEGVRLVEAALGSGLPREALLLSANPAPAIFRESLPFSLRTAQCCELPTNYSPRSRTRGRRKGSPRWCGRDEATIESLRVAERRCWLCLWACRIPATWGRLIRAAEAFGATGAATCAAGRHWDG